MAGVRAHRLAHIADILEVSVDWLLGRSDIMELPEAKSKGTGGNPAPSAHQKCRLDPAKEVIAIMAHETVHLNPERSNRVGAKLELILRAIKTLSARVGSLQESMSLECKEVHSLEESMSLERKEVHPIREDLLRLEHQINRMKVRLDQIERRLNLIHPLDLDYPPE